ncbi:hypothetical protein HOE04_03040 [archaeon]|jgi:hypothetical protein|nr:hypothetical protein [archaeon]
MAVGSMSFSGSVLLMVAIVLGLIASVVTYMNSRKLKGEVFEKPMIYFALGIFLATLSLIAVTFFQGVFSEMTVELIHDISFILGLGLMLLASVKLTRFLQGLSGFEKKLPKNLPSKVK